LGALVRALAQPPGTPGSAWAVVAAFLPSSSRPPDPPEVATSIRGFVETGRAALPGLRVEDVPHILRTDFSWYQPRLFVRDLAWRIACAARDSTAPVERRRAAVRA